MAFGSMGRSYTENDNPFAPTYAQQTANGLGLGFGSIGGPASTTFMNPVQANSIGGGPETGSLSGANGSNGTASYAPTWAGSGVLTNSALIGGNAGWMDGKGNLYAGNYRDGLGFGGEFRRYQDTPFLRQALSNNKASLLNGTPYDVLDANGNVIRSDVWRNLKDNASTQMWDGLVTAAVGGLFGAGALGYLGGAPAAEAGAVGSGAGFVGEGAASGIPAWDAAYAAAPSWTGAAGAAGSLANGGASGFGDAGTMYAGSTASDAATLGGGAAAGSGAGGASNASWIQSLLKGTGMSGGFDWTSLIGPATQLVGGYMNANAASDASDAQLQAAREAAARFEPWTQAGSWSIGQAANMLGKNGSAAAQAAFQQDPGYQWRVQQGENALTRAAAAAGLRGSGKFLKDYASFNQNEASKEFGNSLNRLLAVAGMGQTATGSAADYTTQAGNASAAGAVGRANAYNNALTQGYSMYANQQQQNQNNALLANILASRGY